MYTLFVYNDFFLVACFVNSSPEVTFRTALVISKFTSSSGNLYSFFLQMSQNHFRLFICSSFMIFFILSYLLFVHLWFSLYNTPSIKNRLLSYGLSLPMESGMQNLIFCFYFSILGCNLRKFITYVNSKSQFTCLDKSFTSVTMPWVSVFRAIVVMWSKMFIGRESLMLLGKAWKEHVFRTTTQ
jgi:hypothetical protein